MSTKNTSLVITLRSGSEYGRQRTFSKMKEDVTDTEIHNLGKALGKLFENAVSDYQKKVIEEITI